MDIANDMRTGNCNRLNSNGMSVGIRGIRGMSTNSPFALPVNILASIKFGINLFTANLVPLHSFGAFKFRSKIIDEPTFKFKKCGGIPGGSNEFKDSTG
jgi:hypothetical protein